MALYLIKGPEASRNWSSTAQVMRVAFFVSLLVHVLLLIAFQDAFPINWFPGELRTYQVELLRPPVENLRMEDNAEADISRREEETSEKNEEQDTISLDTKDHRYVSYSGMIKERLMRHWRYPVEARENLIEGRLTALFTITRDGQLTLVEILSSSGFDILDGEAARAIRSSAPFPSFPPEITAKRLNVKASFDYRLRSGG